MLQEDSWSIAQPVKQKNKLKRLLIACIVCFLPTTHSGISLDKLEAAMQRASSILPQHGWPVPPARCWKLAVAQASRAATHPDFLFRDLVRLVWGMTIHVRA